MLAVLAALGSLPASLLPGRTPAAARIAVAPAFGLALGLGLMLSASQLISMATGAWVVLVPAAVVSLGAALLRLRGRPRPQRSGWARSAAG